MINVVNLSKNFSIDPSVPISGYPDLYCRYQRDIGAAKKLVGILEKVPQLKAFGGHYKATPNGGSAWYVGLHGDPDQNWLFNFNVTGNSPSIDFRRIDYLIKSGRYNLGSQYQNLNTRSGQTRYASWNSNIEALLLGSIESYKSALGNGDLSGDSYAEKFIPPLLCSVFENKFDVKTNTHPKWLKGLKGKCYELDHYIEEASIAIENQGQHHYIDGVYKGTKLSDVQERDGYKKKLCKEKGVTLLWIKVAPLSKIYGLNTQEQLMWLKNLIEKAQESEDKFYHWEG
jgi:hypothetical protein